ncbi:MAG: glycosyltransferase [Phycisphaeraceae bacterium]|nr:glycosyltransferase [Phycisphaeraceae bacterium]
MSEKIRFESHAFGESAGRFSVLIPTWNNLPMLRLCIEAVRKHSRHRHQIVVHVNEGVDGTAKWLAEQKIDHTFTPDNAGICHALNAARTLARSPWLLYLNDDMYTLPGWDQALIEEAEKIGHRRFYLSSTMIEPEMSNNPCVIAPHDYGRDVDSFREEALLDEGPTLPFGDWSGATWPPSLVHADLWDEVGGLSPEFSPGIGSDPDFSMKLYQTGVRLFKGVAASRVYHFQSRSTGRVVKNDGRKQFFKKWGMSISTFTRQVLRRGKPFSGPLPEGPIRVPLKDRLRRIVYF